jgi:hypothetical protein
MSQMRKKPDLNLIFSRNISSISFLQNKHISFNHQEHSSRPKGSKIGLNPRSTLRQIM